MGTKLLKKYPSFRVITSGHSLGGADSILTAVALSMHLPIQRIDSISFGSPRVGGKRWTSFVNMIHNLGIWRFVYKDDIVPRLPTLAPPFEPYKHAGHTIQMDDYNATAYYLHVGDKYLGYKGVPASWSFASSPTNHPILNYYDYVKNKTVLYPDMYYANHFLKNETDINNELKHK